MPGTDLVLRGLRHASASSAQARASDDGGGRWIFLHGWLDNAESFSRLVPRLSDDFADVVALDFAGHGLSDHKRGPYHVVDYASEVVSVADACFGKGARFNVLGHSLGGGVALLVAGGWPDRVARCAALESVGVLTADGADAPELLRKACRRSPSGRLTVHADAAAAAKARASKNVVPDARFTAAEAQILASRGLRETSEAVEGKTGVVWRTDPWLLMPSRLRLTRDLGLAFVRGVEAPALVLVAKDGMFRRLRADPFKRATVLAARVLAAALRVAAFVAARVRPAATPKALEDLRRNVALVAEMGERAMALKDPTFVRLRTGGHHVHMTEPEATAAALAAWAAKTRRR